MADNDERKKRHPATWAGAAMGLLLALALLYPISAPFVVYARASMGVKFEELSRPYEPLSYVLDGTPLLEPYSKYNKTVTIWLFNTFGPP